MVVGAVVKVAVAGFDGVLSLLENITSLARFLAIARPVSVRYNLYFIWLHLSRALNLSCFYIV